MRRWAALAAVWVIGTLASIAVAWTAVSAVSGQVTSPPAGGLTAGQVAEAISPAAPTTPPAAPTTPPASSSTQTFESAGGSVGVGCAGVSASLGFATPRPGYATEVHDAGPERVEVRFEGEAGESRITVTCAGGKPAAEIRDD